jgi:hypothetical protein
LSSSKETVATTTPRAKVSPSHTFVKDPMVARLHEFPNPNPNHSQGSMVGRLHEFPNPNPNPSQGSMVGRLHEFPNESEIPDSYLGLVDCAS